MRVGTPTSTSATSGHDMGVRLGKVRRLYNFLVGTTGITGISLDGFDIVMPYPYRVTVSTGISVAEWVKKIRSDNDPKRFNMHIQYNNTVDGPNDAWAAMRLEEFVALLETYHEARIVKEGRTNAPEHRW